MWDRLNQLSAGLDADEGLRCVMIEGAGGEKAFSVGADIAGSEANRSSAEQARIYARRRHGPCLQVAGFFDHSLMETAPRKSDDANGQRQPIPDAGELLLMALDPPSDAGFGRPHRTRFCSKGR